MSAVIRPQKKLGQNFLRDQQTLRQIAAAAKLKNSDTVLEIGTGTGTLTKLLAQAARQVITVEKDPALFQLAQKNLSVPQNIVFLKQDILRFQPQAYNLEASHYKVVGNIPYYLTGKILELLLEEWPRPTLIVLLVQKEVGAKLQAQRKRSVLSVISQLLTEIEQLGSVSRTAFWPSPKVDSVILRFTPFETEVFQKNPGLKRFIKAGFSMPRKLLISNLKASLHWERAQLLKALSRLRWNPKVRPENLLPNDWVKLYQTLHQ